MMVGWFDWRYHICLITSMHLKGYWTWKVLKDITKYCGSKWLALSSQSVLGSARDGHYWSFWFQSNTVIGIDRWLSNDLICLGWVVSDIMYLVRWVFGTGSLVFVLVVSYAICTFLVTWFESTTAFAKSASVIVRENTASKSNCYL